MTALFMQTVILNPKELLLHRTDAGTYRVLVDGNVSPYLVGFQDARKAVQKALKTYPRTPVTIPRHLSDFFDKSVQLAVDPNDTSEEHMDIILL